MISLKELNKTASELILCFLRDLCGVSLIIWCMNPEQRFYNWWIYGVLMITWLLFSFITDKRAWIDNILTKNFFWILFIWPVFCTLMASIGRSNFSLYLFTVPFVYTFFWFYYCQKVEIQKMILKIIMIYYLCINIVSMIRLAISPNISRLLANGNKSMTDYLASPFTANFQHVYTLTMVTVACIGILRFYCPIKLKKSSIYDFKESCRNVSSIQKYILALIVTNILTIFMSKYTYAILFVLIFSLIIVFIRPLKIEKKSLFYYMIIIGCTFANLIMILYVISYFINNQYIIERMNEVIKLVTTGNVSKDKDIYKRLVLYLKSLHTFLESPLLGVGGKVYLADGKIGGHSEFLDCLGYYGIIGFGAFVSAYIFDFKTIIKKISKNARLIYGVVFILFFIQSLFNSCYTEQILIGVFFIIPLGLYYADNFIIKEGE